MILSQDKDVHLDVSENSNSERIHFNFEFANDIKSDILFNTQKKRDTYRKIALTNMEKLFDEFYKRYRFKPDHKIHVTISEYVNGGKNSAYTTKTFEGIGRIVKLSMHFPYEMFKKEYVRAHELTHAFIAPFFLPTWADEGFAVLNENYYSDTERHPVFDSFEKDLRMDQNQINAVQHWTEGFGIYSDYELTIWCYRYSHTIVKYIETNWEGTFAKVFDNVHSHSTLSNEEFISMLDDLIPDKDMIKWFRSIGFRL